MKGFLFLTVLMGSFTLLMAQNITAVEYFVDTDPGCGNGTNVSITPAPSITNLTFNIDITGESEGFHTLFMRAQDANGFWSAAYSKPFYKLSAASVSPLAANITKMEYFIDTDPGYGAGTDVPITAARSVSDHTFTIPLTSISDGFHTLSVRTQDDKGNWSPVYSKPFYKLGAETIAAVPDITKIEYFIGDDPGYGAGVDVPVTAAQSISDLTFAVPMNSLPEGDHFLTVRAQDANGNWSMLTTQIFAVCNHPATTAQPAEAISSSGVNASWSESPGTVSYELEVSTDNFNTLVPGYDPLVVNAPSTTASVSGLDQTTAYQYRIRAVGSCPSPWSNTIAFTTFMVAPVASGVGQNQFTIQWTTVAGVAEYHLDVSNDNFATRITGYDDLAVAGPSFTITGLEPGITYQYRLRALTTTGTSIYSEIIAQPTVPVSPELSNASDIGQHTFAAHWAAVAGASDYLIDVSQSADFLTFVSNYWNKSVGNVTSEVVSGLTPGITYYYRVRAANSGGVSPNSDPAQSVLLLPKTPLALDATNATSSTFKAKWEAVPNVTGYQLDVTLASDDFNPSLTSHTNKTITGLTEELVTDLLPNTAYKYRVRAVNASGTSPSSLPVSVSTLEVGTGTPLGLKAPVFSSAFDGTTSTVSIEAEGGTPPYSVVFYFRGITGRDYSSSVPTASGPATYETVIDAFMLDEMGLEFYFGITDANGFQEESVKYYLYQSIPPEGYIIPLTASGGTARSYEIFSIPYTLEDNLIASVFDELGEYDKSRWRLVRYQGGKNVDFREGLNRIELGNGYWVNRKEYIDISFSGGMVAQANQETDAVIRLEPGWNQIGNPLPFDVDWDDVLAANPGVDLIGNLKVFNPEAFHLNDESNLLRTWSGGFVHNGNAALVELKLPVTLRNSAGGRKASRALPDSRLDQPDWFVPIAITQGQVRNEMGGIGMHPEASASIDRFDDFVVPRFMKYLEFYSRHDEFFTPKFSRDIVRTADSFTWNLQFESNGGSEPVTFSWDPHKFGLNDAELFLFDVSQNLLVDMRTTSSYQFHPLSEHAFRILYGMDSGDVDPRVTSLGKAYPNSFASHTTIPFMIAADQSHVVVDILDVLGKQQTRLVNAVYKKGIHEVTWDGTDDSGGAVPSGVYLYRMQANGMILTGRVIKK